MCCSDQKQALLILHERKSRLTLTSRLPDTKTETVAGHLADLLYPLPKSDQDMEDIIMNYNDTPRKCLGFQSPFNAFIKSLSENVALGL